MGKNTRALGTKVKSVTIACSDVLDVDVVVIKVMSRWPTVPTSLGTLAVTVTMLCWPGVRVMGVVAVTLLHGCVMLHCS